MKIPYDVIIGIDPGRKGAMCQRIMKSGDLSFCFMPVKKAVYPIQYTKTGKVKKVKRKKSEPATVFDLREILNTIGQLSKGKKTLVVIEEQHGRPTDGKHNVLEVGKSQAYLEMAAVASGCDYVIISPRTWKACYLPPGAEKSESIVVAKSRYPAVEFPLVKDEAKAEALLMVDYVLNNFEVISQRIKGNHD